MKKIDIHLHLTLQQYPKTDTMFLSSAAQMLPHLEELGIEQGIVLSSGEQENEQILVAANEECKRICEQFPKKFHWMCNVDAKNQTDVYKRILACKESGAVGIGELMVNQRLDAPFLQSVFEVAEELKLPVYRISYFNQLLKEIKGTEITKNDEYKNIINQLDKEQLEEEIKVPENLNSVLRYYQKTGFKWLKILDRYHFGGILADDMGLRKNYSNVISNS